MLTGSKNDPHVDLANPCLGPVFRKIRLAKIAKFQGVVANLGDNLWLASVNRIAELISPKIVDDRWSNIYVTAQDPLPVNTRLPALWISGNLPTIAN